MAYKINPFHQLLWRNPNTLQIGVGSQRVILEQLSPSEERLVDALYYGIPTESLPALAGQIDLPLDKARNLIERLQPTLLLDSSGVNAVPVPTAETDLHLHQAEVVRAGLISSRPATLIAEHRTHTVVHLDSLDSTGLTLLLALAAAGVGTFTTKDHGRVVQSDIASGVYPKALLGRSRFGSAKLMLESSWPNSRLVTTNRPDDRRTARANVAITVSQQITRPEAAAVWRTMDLPVLEIRYEPEGVQVSPVLTGTNGCLVCRDHWNQDQDEAHLIMASQLIGSTLTFDDSATRLLASGLAVSLVLRFLDQQLEGHSPWDESGAAIGFRFLRGQSDRLLTTEWLRHPLCGCGITSTRVLREAG